MPEISPRLTGINEGGDDGWGVFYKARRMKADGIDVTELTIGEHDIRTDPAILDAMHAAARGGHTGYAMIPGVAALRQRVADRIRNRTGVATTQANVLITPGGQAGLFAAHVAACPPGRRALYIDPYYATYPGTLRAAGAQAVAIPTRSEDGFLPDPAAVDAAAAQGAASLLINSPNNPTGVVYPDTTLRALADICTDRDLWLISDEVYDTQVWQGTHLSPRALPGMADRTLVIGSMSKSHAMTGSRIGWIVGPEPAIAALIDLATTTTYGVPGFIQDAALFALDQGTAFEARIAEPFRRRRDAVLDVIARQQIVRAIPSSGAMYLMLDIRATGLSGQDFALHLLDSHRIAVMPGESFGRSAAGHLRVALTVADDRLVQAVETLCAFAAKAAISA
ncbi:pyridoxal phosphate-dependent aminotransferase [Thalassococcus sp. CAU 1522]|uniref:Pyridoxal phosphate-dependent aminotransferase n=1 Tax=Thalassococcus arenae TaxID=2851652 RepID=A0ABS6NBD1_9RHOB|nr:pyridoxal phosphate-dependent aminotransferase [Thalassococcus arenae]MBV2361336.1 pyridoxal phosphate-dependent aminotransferase [Thalassococcus arenae]